MISPDFMEESGRRMQELSRRQTSEAGLVLKIITGLLMALGTARCFWLGPGFYLVTLTQMIGLVFVCLQIVHELRWRKLLREIEESRPKTA